MAAAAVVRVKRHLNNEPVESVLFNYKRRKVNNIEEDEPVTGLLQFAGTVTTQEENILKIQPKTLKASIENEYKLHSIDVRSKMRTERRMTTDRKRFKVVSCFRHNQQLNGLNNNSDNSLEDSKDITVFDVESAVDGTSVATSKTINSGGTNENYVYDLYYTTSDYLGDEQNVSFEPLNEYSLYTSSAADDDNEEEAGRYDVESDDSNAENYWKNDYPDEDVASSVTEDDMIAAMHRLDMDNELSSENDDNGDCYYSDDKDSFLSTSFDRNYSERFRQFTEKHKRMLAKTEDYDDCDDSD